SHVPPAGRHTAPDALFASGGQLALVPVQVSARSQTPADARHTVPEERNPSVGHAVLEPEHTSTASHGPTAARQTVPAGRLPSLGQLVLVPVQASTASHAPAAPRHTAPAFPAGCWQTSLLPLHVSVVHGLPSSMHAVPLAFNVQSVVQHELAVP